MAKKLQLRGGTTAEHSSFTGALREVTVDTDKDVLVVHDGSTAGGFPQNGMGVVSSLTVSGTVETSTSGENVTGTSDVVTPTVAGVKEMVDTHGIAGDLLAASNLSDIGTAATALTNLGGIGAATSDTLTNKSIDLANNTVTSTLAQLNTAVSDGTLVSNAITASSTETLTNKTIGAFSLDATPGADHTAVGPQTNTLTAGYSSAVMDLVYLGSASKWLEADADAAGTSINLLGIALEAKTDTQAMAVALSGSFVRDDTWAWTPGVPLYISGTIGEITATKPAGTGDIVRTVGYAVTADIIFFAPSSDYVTLA